MSRPWVLLGAASILHLGCASARVGDGPLFVFNEHPAQRTTIRAAPRDAAVLAPGDGRTRAALAWTSHWLQDGTGPDRVVQDGETIWLDLECGLGLGGGFEIELRASLGHASGGVLDGFIESWHEFFGLPQSQRDQLPQDRYEMRFEHVAPNGDDFVAHELAEDELLVGDLPVFLVWQLPGEDELALSLRAGIELPLGSESDGSGNGAIDVLLGAQSSWRPNDRLTAHVWASYAFVGNSEAARRAGIELEDVTRVGGAFAVRIAPGLAGLAQLQWEQSVLRAMDEERASADQLLLWLGGRVALAEGVGLEFGIAEDLVLQISPDVQFHVGIVLD